MTDTAQPLPNEIEPGEEPGELTPAMKQRAAALTEARFLLSQNTGGPFTNAQKLSERFTVQDLLTVGDYILGVGPFVSLEQVGAAPIEAPSAEPGEPYATPYPPEDRPLPAGLEHVATFRPHQGVSIEPDDQPMAAEDEHTEALPAYPEDALPR